MMDAAHHMKQVAVRLLLPGIMLTTQVAADPYPIMTKNPLNEPPRWLASVRAETVRSTPALSPTSATGSYAATQPQSLGESRAVGRICGTTG